MSPLKALSFVAVSVFSFISVNSASADILFTDVTSFEAALTGPIQIERFEDDPVIIQSGARTLHTDFFNISYNGSNEFSISNVVGANGIGPTEGSNYLFAIYDAINDRVRFDFHHPVFAFGVNLKDVETENLLYQITGGSNGVAGFPLNNGDVQYFGILTDQPFKSISFTRPLVPLGGDGVVFDAITLVSPVPEPSVISLMLIALGAGSFVFVRSNRNLSRKANKSVS